MAIHSKISCNYMQDYLALMGVLHYGLESHGWLSHLVQ